MHFKSNSYLLLLLLFSCSIFSDDEKENAIAILNVSVLSGEPGTQIYIYGRGFPEDASATLIEIGGLYADIFDATTTSRGVIIPEGLLPGNYIITIFINGRGYTYSKEFNVLQGIPRLTHIKEDNGVVGDTIIIFGSGFDSIAVNNVVKFNDIEAKVIEAVAESNSIIRLKAIVPNGAGIGKIKLSVTVNKKTGLYEKGFDLYFTERASFPGVLKEPSATFSINNKGYVLLQKELWEYDPSSNLWTKKANFPGRERSGAVSFSIGNKTFYGTGKTNLNTPQDSVLKDLWEYDQTTNIWTPKNYFNGKARMNATAFVVGEKGYLSLGNSSIRSSNQRPDILNDIWEYDWVNDNWIEKGDFVDKRQGAQTFTIEGAAYLYGGDKGDLLKYGTRTYYYDFFYFSSTSKQWFYLFNKITKAAFGINKSAYLLTSPYYYQIEKYSPKNNLATFFTTVPKRLGSMHSIRMLIGGKVYLGGNYDYKNEKYESNFWEFDPLE